MNHSLHNHIQRVLTKDEIWEINKNKTKRKRGRPLKRDTTSILHDPREIVDYIINIFPECGVDKYRNQILEKFDCLEEFEQPEYILDKIVYDGIPYYYDEWGKVFNKNVELVGNLDFKNKSINFI